ncbi:hypothetical protein KR51_00001780, partial [Rubidibacter lacunae KORDI 51-2]
NCLPYLNLQMKPLQKLMQFDSDSVLVDLDCERLAIADKL